LRDSFFDYLLNHELFSQKIIWMQVFFNLLLVNDRLLKGIGASLGAGRISLDHLSVLGFRGSLGILGFNSGFLLLLPLIYLISL